MSELYVLEKPFLPQKLGKWTKNRVFWIWRKISSLNFTQFVLYWKFILFAVLLHKSYIWEKAGSWDICQNALSQSDCRIFKYTISPDHIDETASFFACWYKFTRSKSWLKIFFGLIWWENGVANLVSEL